MSNQPIVSGVGYCEDCSGGKREREVLVIAGAIGWSSLIVIGLYQTGC